MRTNKHLVAVEINTGVFTEMNFQNSLGMMGSFNGTLLARDGMTVTEDLNAFGQEWKVTDEEPMMFHTARAPQYPSQCILPSPKTMSQRKLGETLSREAAEEACSHLSSHKAEFEHCVYDAIATGDLGQAPISRVESHAMLLLTRTRSPELSFQTTEARVEA